MSRNINQQEAMRIAAEKMRLKREKEEREEREFYERITSGSQWLIFKVVVGFCTLMALLITIETFVDGSTKKIGEDDWKVDRDWEWTWHKFINVEGYIFAPEIVDWGKRVEGSIELTYSPIFHAGKKLSFDMQMHEHLRKSQEEIRFRSIFTWFPFVQIFLLIPLLTFLFKRQKPWFNFARLASLAVVFPGTLMIFFYALL